MLMDKTLMIKIKPIKPVFHADAKPDFKSAAREFFKGNTGAFGPYVSTKNALVYRTLSTVDGYSQEVICLRLIQEGEVFYLGNSSRFELVGSVVAFGSRSRRGWGETPEQASLVSSGIPMLPFEAFREAGLKLTDTEILDRGPSETVRRITGHDRKENPIFGEVHFTGASLFKNGAKTFLFDVDRGELPHGIFNPFIVELGREAATVVEAYAGLKPDAVADAERAGLTVLRQGEFFFIKRGEASAYSADSEPVRFRDGETEDNKDRRYTPAHLSAQGNRDHVASLFNKESGFVSGFVEHSGREHKNLMLDGWFQVIPNTAVRAFTITGDVD